MTAHKILISRIEAKEAKVAIIGLGYVGLPLAIEFAQAGLTTIGIDLDADKIGQVNAGISYVDDVSDVELQQVIEAGKLQATSNYAALDEIDCICISVPTPLSKTRDPDISFIVSACEEIEKYFRPGVLIVLESTTYPGTTEEVILPRLTAQGGLVGKDFFLAFSPERVDPGNLVWKTRNTPKVIGGMTLRCTEVATALYSHAVDTLVPLSSPAAAEMVKILENTFRSVNIGLANEVALICDRLGLDVWEIIEAAATKPFGFMKFTPGPGLGGHCIPIDPLYLSWKMRGLNYEARFVDLADKVNAEMPHHVVHKIMDALNEDGKPLMGSRTLILGVAYKNDIGDVRESPALLIIEQLLKKGADVVYNDPFVPNLDDELEGVGYSVELNETEVSHADCLVVVAAHSCYDWEWVANHAALIVDTRNALDGCRGKARVIGL